MRWAVKGGGGEEWGLACADPVFVKYSLVINDIFTISWIEDLLRFKKHTGICVYEKIT